MSTARFVLATAAFALVCGGALAADENKAPRGFNQMDKNSDGKLTRQEAAGNQELLAKWKEADKNNDGTIDRVNRGPNEERGGVYVRIAHRQGTVFTQYFHLAAVPKWIKEGVEVQAGQVIGLLGDTGVHHSAPHLHFTISVKPSPDLPEQYIDPEPLIALWPVWMPEGMGQGRLSTMEPPGLPVRGSKRYRSRGRPWYTVPAQRACGSGVR